MRSLCLKVSFRISLRRPHDGAALGGNTCALNAFCGDVIYQSVAVNYLFSNVCVYASARQYRGASSGAVVVDGSVS